jgi:hypothetical protein
MSSNALPTALYEGLLLKLVAVLELTQKPEGTVTPQAKQALLQATNEFKNALNQAKELADALPGGDLLVEEQDEVIHMLETLRDHKKRQLSQFSTRLQGLPSSSDPAGSAGESLEMEVDSMASTPGLV